MDRWMKITLLLATQLCAAWTEDCDDPCFCPAAKTVDCDNRGLSQPPPGHWPEITTLSLRGNSISVLRKRSLTGFPNIVTLDMNRNRLIELDLETFAALPYLRHLDLEKNAIATISPAPPGVTIGSLFSLYINENKISSLDPDVFAAATNLNVLYLYENPLSAKEGEPFLNHPTIRFLEMADTLLTLHSLGPEIFNGLPKLESIELYNLNIKNISGAFVKNPDLYYIRLSRNLISEVTAGTFAPANKLVALHLSNTPLERLDVSAVADAVPSGGSIFIEDTPLACSCEYQSLYWWAKGKGVYLGVRCAGKEPCSFARSPTSS